MLGLITDIQRFSLNDGPGIRTTVFGKGCNMRCAWCHNPETIRSLPELQFFPDKCIRCGNCAPGADTPHAAAEDLLTDTSGQSRHYRGNCQSRALVKIGRAVTAQDVLNEAKQDLRFYQNSHGGVTLSGGEITTQAEFTFETLTLLKANGIHTAIETNLHGPWEMFEKLLPILDLVMFDIKSMNNNRHREWTGIGHERILSNALAISRTGIPLIVRTPVIPGFNDEPGEISSVAEYIRDFPNLDYYELLAFNPLGADKYRCLGMVCRMENSPLVPTETMQALQQAAAAHGIEVRIA
jgi:pyruvate formate lyase activating enzyme